MSQCAHLYVYKHSENKKEDEIELSSNEIASKIDTHNELLQNCFKNFTNFTNFGIELSKTDIERLKPRCWLNDNLVNYYLHLLSSSTSRKSMNFESYFYSSLIQRGHYSMINWFKNVNIFEFDIVYIPININNNHWILATIESFKCKVTVYDSFKSNQSNVLTNLHSYINMKYNQYYKVNLTNHWCFTQEYNIPLQKNTYDCGVFLCKIAQIKSLNSDCFNFFARDMDYYRKNVLLSILTSKIY